MNIKSKWFNKKKKRNEFFCLSVVLYAWYFYISTIWYDIFAHTKLHIDSTKPIYFISSTSKAPNCPLNCEWKMNCNSIDLVILINIYVSSLCMVYTGTGTPNNKHNKTYSNSLVYKFIYKKKSYLLLNDCYVNLFLIYSINLLFFCVYIIWDVSFYPFSMWIMVFHLLHCMLCMFGTSHEID